MEDEQIENCAIWVAQYIDKNGDMPYVVKTRGDVNTSTLLGLLEMAKHDIMKARDGG